MIFIPRRVNELTNDNNSLKEAKHNEPLISFRNDFAWVLLGEPGAGKSLAFQNEAHETGNMFLRITEFIHADPEPEWRNKTLFLDGLDEVRANGKESSTLQAVQKQLKILKYPPFRIACRAADWYGATDIEDLKSATLNQEIKILQLAPLTHEEILAILETHQVSDCTTFLEKANQHGIADLLTNPQTLDLLIKAIGIHNKWPDTRDEVFQLACEKLTEESNKFHRDLQRSHPINKNKILEAAGYLSALLLLSGKIGFALDQANANDHFIQLEDCIPLELETAFAAVRKKLFRLEGEEEKVIPYHRNIAEYLASKWLADQINNKKIPLIRILNLLLGSSDRVIAGLRGLYGWLALHCISARRQLIEVDPFTVIIYGDVKPMSTEDRHHIIDKLYGEAEHLMHFLQERKITHSLSALVDPLLKNKYNDILQSDDRTDTNQAYVQCILMIIAQNNILDLQDALYEIVRDDSRWLGIRRNALEIWLRKSTPDLALTLLNEINNNYITDPDDELAGTLLSTLYPKHIHSEVLFNYFHTPKNPNLIGVYAFFWTTKLALQAAENDLPLLMDQLAENPTAFHQDTIMQLRFAQMTNSILLRSIEISGDNISDIRLYKWLGIETHQDQQKIKDWLEARPEKYRSLLSICFELCDKQDKAGYCLYKSEQRLRNARPPANIGLWHLEQVSIAATNNLAKLYFSAAMNAFYNQPDKGGLSLEYLYNKASTIHPHAKEWLDELSKSDYPAWRQQIATDESIHTQKKIKQKEDHAAILTKHLPAILNGTAHPSIMYELAGVWEKRFLEVSGDTVIDRFKNFYAEGSELLKAAEKGFQLSPFRRDLPSVKEIITLRINHKEHFLHTPCLIGLELLQENNPSKIEALPEDILCRMIAFQLTSFRDKEVANWFAHFINNYPNLIAEILIKYANAELKSGGSFIRSIYSLNHDVEYKKIAIVAAPSLLKNFPLRVRNDQLNILDNLLKAALRYTPEKLRSIVRKKITQKSMDIAQKIYWHTANALLNSEKSQNIFWKNIKNTETHVKHLCQFLFDEENLDNELPASMISRLIELIAPYADMEPLNSGGWISDSRRRGYQIRSLTRRLSSIPTTDAALEIDRLLLLNTTGNIKLSLEDARYQQKLRQRENDFSFMKPQEIAQILANKAPANVADLSLLTLEAISTIENELRTENDDGKRGFWNFIKKGKKEIIKTPRDENQCRDILLYRLRNHLIMQTVDCQPEGDYHNDKRADIRVSYTTKLDLPIEIKRDDNEGLWSGLHNQLINQYAITPKADHHGIYIVIWFGGEKLPRAIDGGKKPRTPGELQSRLENSLQPIDRKRIFIKVIDVT